MQSSVGPQLFGPHPIRLAVVVNDIFFSRMTLFFSQINPGYHFELLSISLSCSAQPRDCNQRKALSKKFVQRC